MSATSEFTYIFGEKDDLLIILLQGKITSKDVSLLDQCANEILEKNHKIVLFFFRDLLSFIPAAHPSFAKIQKTLREKNKLLGMCSLKPDLKMVLLQEGIIRESEIFNNLPDAWKKLSQK